MFGHPDCQQLARLVPGRRTLCAFRSHVRVHPDCIVCDTRLWHLRLIGRARATSRRCSSHGGDLKADSGVNLGICLGAKSVQGVKLQTKCCRRLHGINAAECLDRSHADLLWRGWCCQPLPLYDKDVLTSRDLGVAWRVVFSSLSVSVGRYLLLGRFGIVALICGSEHGPR
jgi:hypothetical protein